MKLRWPFQRAIGVHLFMASGNVVRFTVDSFQSKTNEYGQLIDIGWTGGLNAPGQVEFSRVEAIQTVAVFRRRRKTPEEA